MTRNARATDSLSFSGDLSVRPARAGDAAFLRRLHDDNRDDLRLIEGEPDFVQSVIDLQFHAKTVGYGAQFPNALQLVAESAGTPIGVIAVDQTGGADWRVVDIALIPPARGKGYGTQLLRGLLEAAALKGVPVTLSVMRSNGAAFRAYSRLGFKVTGQDAVRLEMAWTPPPARRSAVILGGRG